MCMCHKNGSKLQQVQYPFFFFCLVCVQLCMCAWILPIITEYREGSLTCFTETLLNEFSLTHIFGWISTCQRRQENKEQQYGKGLGESNSAIWYTTLLSSSAA